MIFLPIMKIICIILFDWKLEINFIVSFDNLGFLFKILREPNLDQDTDPRYFFSILNWVKFRWVRVLRDLHWGVHRAFMSCVQTDDASISKSKGSSFLSLKYFYICTVLTLQLGGSKSYLKQTLIECKIKESVQAVNTTPDHGKCHVWKRS